MGVKVVFRCPGCSKVAAEAKRDRERVTFLPCGCVVEIGPTEVVRRMELATESEVVGPGWKCTLCSVGRVAKEGEACAECVARYGRGKEGGG